MNGDSRFQYFLIVLITLPGFFLLSPVTAQDLEDVSVSLWGAFQPRFSYAISDDSTGEISRQGFGLRRARLRFEASLDNKLGVRYDSDFASGVFQSVDLFAFYRINSEWRLRVGIMPSAQPRAHIFTPIPFIDGFDRAAIAEQWARSTLGGGGRDFGVDVQYENSAWTLVLFLHNGDGGFGGSRGNFSRTISSRSATGGIDRTSLATSLYAAHRTSIPGLEFGGYLSHNPTENPNTALNGIGRTYLSYAVHVYYGARPGSQPFRAKFDLIGISFDGENVDQDQLGLSILGAVRLAPHAELFARYENAQQDVDLDGDSFWSTGISYSISGLLGGPFHTQRVTFGYSLLDSAAGTQEHLVVLQLNLII